MGEFFQMIADFVKQLISTVDTVPLVIGNYQVSYFAVVFACLVVAFVIAYFWKGART